MFMIEYRYMIQFLKLNNFLRFSNKYLSVMVASASYISQCYFGHLLVIILNVMIIILLVQRVGLTSCHLRSLGAFS